MLVVTGANGFIGSALIWELNSQGRRDIIAVDRVSPSERPELLSRLNFENFMTADEFLRFIETPAAQPITGIFHMGACSSTTEMNETFLREVNTDYSKKVFLAATHSGWPLIYASSGAIYGDGQKGFDDQPTSAQYQPLNPYGWSKLNFDVWAEQQTQTPPVWYGLRFFNVYGPNEYHKGEMSSVVFKATEQISKTGKLRLFRSHHPDFADGKQLRDFVYVKDITAWMWDLHDRAPAPSGIYNMGYGQARTWLDLATAVFSNLDRSLAIEWIDIPEKIRGQYQYFTEAKMSKLMGGGLQSPRWPLELGVADYVKKYLQLSNPYLKGGQ